MSTNADLHHRLPRSRALYVMASVLLFLSACVSLTATIVFAWVAVGMSPLDEDAIPIFGLALFGAAWAAVCLGSSRGLGRGRRWAHLAGSAVLILEAALVVAMSKLPRPADAGSSWHAEWVVAGLFSCVAGLLVWSALARRPCREEL